MACDSCSLVTCAESNLLMGWRQVVVADDEKHIAYTTVHTPQCIHHSAYITVHTSRNTEDLPENEQPHHHHPLPLLPNSGMQFCGY